MKEEFMRRALSLARLGEGMVSPNPMVGAVIEYNGKIIGEGWHRRYGEAHAEVNAVASVKDKSLLKDSTIYVTLEPCSHYGKTPPCSKLLIDCGIPRIVVACADPFREVSGRGIAMLREAGREVVCGVLEEEARHLNRKFITAHTEGRPYIMLKWAETADGYMGGIDSAGNPCPLKLSNTLTQAYVHRIRSYFDAIMVGTGTVVIDNPRLNVRKWHGRSPRPVTLDFRRRIPRQSFLRSNPGSIVFDRELPLKAVLKCLYREHGIISLLVEGGARLLRSFIEEDLWDEARIERTPLLAGSGVAAPTLRGIVTAVEKVRDSVITKASRVI